MDRNLWLLDWKSSKDCYDEYRIQVAAYAGMHYNLTGEQIDHVGVLIVNKETGIPTFHDASEDAEANWNAFCHLRDYYRIKIEPYIDLKRFYPYEDKKFPTVTGILDLLKKDALPPWAANEAVNYIRDNLDKLRDQNTEQTTVDYILKQARSAFRRASTKAMDTGTIVHNAIEAYMSGMDPDDILGDNEKAKTSFGAFRDWAKTVELEPIHLEHQLIDPMTETGGTCDFLGWLTLPEEGDK